MKKLYQTIAEDKLLFCLKINSICYKHNMRYSKVHTYNRKQSITQAIETSQKC